MNPKTQVRQLLVAVGIVARDSGDLGLDNDRFSTRKPAIDWPVLPESPMGRLGHLRAQKCTMSSVSEASEPDPVVDDWDQEKAFCVWGDEGGYTPYEE
jgi:hypothetical protein